MSSFANSAIKPPNILICGTPGTGKTATATVAAERLGFKYINVGDLVKEHNCHSGKDEVFDSYIIEDEKILEVLEPLVADGGCVLDFHDPGLLPGNIDQSNCIPIAAHYIESFRTYRGMD